MFPTFTEMSLSSGKLGVCPCGCLSMKPGGKRCMWLHHTKSAWAMLWNIWVDQLNLSWEENLHMSLFERSEINKVGLLNLGQTRTVTYWERRKWMSLENITRSIETDWNIHTYQHLANLVALTRCAINTWWIAIYVYVFTNTYIYI